MSRTLSDISPLFVMGFGRSGTTLLRRLLNSYPDVFIRGEHHGYLRHVAEGFHAMWNSEIAMSDPRPWQQLETDPLRASDPAQSWLNPLDRDGWIGVHRRYLDSIFLPPELHRHRYVGFKDTQYFYHDVDRTIDFLKLLYPHARFVFIVRHGLNSLASWHAAHENLRKLSDCARLSRQWSAQTDRLKAIHASGSVDSYWVVYEELLRGEGGIHSLLRSMGRELGEAQRAVLAAPPGASSSFAPGDATGFNKRWRTIPCAWRALGTTRMQRTLRGTGYQAPRGVALNGAGWTLSQLMRLRTITRLVRHRFRVNHPGGGVLSTDTHRHRHGATGAEPPA
jgi:hypothetical protein